MLEKPLSQALKTTSRYLEKLKEHNIKTVEDLLLNFPRLHRDLSAITKISELKEGEINNFKGEIISLVKLRSKTGKSFIKGVFGDDTGKIDVIWFNQPHILRLIRKGDKLIFSGKVKYDFGRYTMISPAFEATSDDLKHTGRIIPIYSESPPITSKWLRTKIYSLLSYSEKIEENLPEEIIKKFNLQSRGEAIKNIHYPENSEKIEQAKNRLGFEELFFLQMKALKNREEWRKEAEKRGMKIKIDRDCLSEIASTLPFKLTENQKVVITEILNDLKKNYPMMRLIEGDVGSGKTILAALAAFNVIRNGYQVAMMVPTEILANQHFKTMLKLLTPHNVRVDALTGSMSAKEKERIVLGLKNKSIDFIIGTHALIQEKVDFQSLGLAIIDEQHRFGVKQRDILSGYGTPHILSLTATPIPRTLAMVIYGDQDLSILSELPPGRKEILTRIVPEEKRRDAYLWVDSEIRKGRQAYIVCPLINESDAIDAKAAEIEYEKLQKVFPLRNLGLLHGRLKHIEKEKVMADFIAKKIDILVSTTVIEVGIDVPNANIMMIEAAERFGLAQLHQLRGRVGRSEKQSYCFLMPQTKDNVENERLKAMVSNSSGFKLAEIDLKLRGPGEVYGVRQSGIPDLKIASIFDRDLVEKTKIAAREWLGLK